MKAFHLPDLGEGLNEADRIAMGYVDTDHANDERFKIDIRGKSVMAKKVSMPFYKRDKS